MWSRCLWASQILWWILTSSGWRLLCYWKSLLSSHFDWIKVLDFLNVLLNFQIYCLVVNDPSLLLKIASEVDVFEVPDSVMLMNAFMRLEVSVEVSIWLNRCFRRFKLFLENSDWLLSSQSSFPSALQAC